jgi:hypothetical protein
MLFSSLDSNAFLSGNKALSGDPGVNSVLSASNLDQVTETFRGDSQSLQTEHTLMSYR